MNGHYEIGEVVLGNWTLTRKLGEGSFGTVYEADRRDFGVTYKSAIKIITIPKSDSEIKAATAEGMDEKSIRVSFHTLVEDVVQEFVFMSKLKGTSNVVSYEDHMVLEHKDRIGWDIIIRMELLTPLLDYVQSNHMTQRDIVKAGIDICNALELCQKYNIVHRDVKPENIFVSELGDYKLGDFGIARTIEKTTGGLSKKGTYTYMAPEVYKNEEYGASVDVYSLGIVLYSLLNNNRAPFLPDYPAPITYSDRESAIANRLSGAAIPEPKNATGQLARIVLKACSFRPDDRYSSPAQMRQELEAVINENDCSTSIDGTYGKRSRAEESQKEIMDDSVDKTIPIFGGIPQAGKQEPKSVERKVDEGREPDCPPVPDPLQPNEDMNKSKKKALPLVAAGIAAVAIIGGIAIGIGSKNGNTSDTVTSDEVETPVSETIISSDVGTGQHDNATDAIDAIEEKTSDDSGIGDAYKEAVAYMMKIGAFLDVGENASESEIEEWIRPRATFYRSEAAKILAYMMLGPVEGNSLMGTGDVFSDVPANAWYSGYVEYCVNANVMNGREDNTFDPDGKITGIEFAKCLLCAYHFTDDETRYIGTNWEERVLQDARLCDLNYGDPNMLSDIYLTRQQAALMAYNMRNSQK